MPAQIFSIDEILSYIESFAPQSLAEEWDNVGVMIGDRSSKVKNVVLSLDASREAFDLCEETGSELLITHHPFIFTPISSIDYQTPQGALLRDFISKNITVYSAHTNLDRANGGDNHALAAIIGLAIPMTITGVSYGLCGDLREIENLFALSARVKRLLAGFGMFINMDCDRQIGRVFLQGGAFDSAAIPELGKANVDLVISGEIKYHDMVSLRQNGIAALSVGHDVSERIVLPSLMTKLNLQFPGLGVATSAGLDYNKIVF